MMERLPKNWVYVYLLMQYCALVSSKSCIGIVYTFGWPNEEGREGGREEGKKEWSINVWVGWIHLHKSSLGAHPVCVESVLSSW